MEDKYYSILEVATMLNITTQAVYKRLQQDKNTLNPYVENVNNKKSLSVEGIKELAKLMSLENPLDEDGNIKEIDAEEAQTNNSKTASNEELLDYLKLDNERLRKEVEELKAELTQTRALREKDQQTALEERREYEESRKRSDTLLMRAMMVQEEKQKPSLLARIFRKNKNNKQDKEKQEENFAEEASNAESEQSTEENKSVKS